jgi:hypothetical protein
MLDNDSFGTFFRTILYCLICKARALYLGRWTPLLGTRPLYSWALKLSVRASAIVNSRGRGQGGASPEMEFWDIKMTKDSSLLLHLLPADFYRKPYPYSVSKNPNKNPRNKKSRVSSWIAFCRTEKGGEKTRQKLESEKARVYAQKPRLKTNSRIPSLKAGKNFIYSISSVKYSSEISLNHC